MARICKFVYLDDNDCHFNLAIKRQAGFAGALIHGYIHFMIEEHPDVVRTYRWAKVTQDRMREKFDLSKREVLGAFKALIAHKLIICIKRKRVGNIYTVVDWKKRNDLKARRKAERQKCNSTETVPLNDGNSTETVPLDQINSTETVPLIVPKRDYCRLENDRAAPDINVAMSDPVPLGIYRNVDQYERKGGLKEAGAPLSNAISSQIDLAFPPPLNDHNLTLETPEPEIPVPEHVKIFLGSWVRAIRKTLPSSRLSIGDMAQLTGRAAAQIGGTDEDVFDTVAYVSEVGSEHLRQVFFMNPGLIMSLNQYGYTYIEEARSKCVIWQKSVTAKRRFR